MRTLIVALLPLATALAISVALPVAAELPEGTYVANVDGTSMLRIAGPTKPAWFPSCNRLLLAISNALYTINADGTDKACLYRDRSLLAIDHPVVSSTGRYAAAAVTPEREWYARLRVWDAETGHVLLDEQAYSLGEGVRWHDSAWSPQGDRLAWAYYDPYDQKPQDYVKTHDMGDGPTLTLANGVSAYCLTWHPVRNTVVIATARGSVIELDPRKPIGQYGVLVKALPQVGFFGWNYMGELVWLPHQESFFIGKGAGRGFFDLMGERVPPRWSADDMDLTWVRCLWVAPHDTAVILGVDTEAENEDEPERPFRRTTLIRCQVPGTVEDLTRLTVLPCLQDDLAVSPDGASPDHS
ncbi:MAG: hypothetical protein FJX75_12550 [Armatimonadetes bacterium]|nr:hypothetical protein [Armatimonadota bacterium]